LSFVNFQEKLTGTSFALCACEASFVRLAVCLALSALFASTPRNILEISVDEVSQPPQVVVLPPPVRGRRAAADFLESAGLQLYFSIAKKYLTLESSAATYPMSFGPLSGFRRLINISISSKHNASG
jgi:hypothetical protein